MAWVFLMAYAGVIGPVAERTGFFAALMFIIGIGFGEPSVAHAARYAGLVAVGGMLAILVITVFWPFHPHRPVVRAWGRSIVAAADLLELVAQSAPGRVLDRAAARAKSLGHEAEAVTRWHAVRASRTPPMPDQLRALAQVGERACTYAVLLADEFRRRDESPGAAPESRRLAADLGEGLAAVGRNLDRDGRPGRSSTAEARRICDSVTSRLTSGHQDDLALSALVAELWAQEAWLALSVPADQMTPAVRGQIDTAAARVEFMTRVLAGSDLIGRGEADRSSSDTAGPARTDLLPGSLIEAIESVEVACADLERWRRLETGAERRLQGVVPTVPE